MVAIQASVSIDRRRVRGVVDPAIYGQFVEHIGRAIYGGLYEPGSPHSDEAGYRVDAIQASKAMGPTVLRWPGGNFASGYHWRDGVGPVADRPTRHDLAWDAYDDNSFGTEEFLEVCRRLGARPYINLNASTGTIDEALGWVEYCNGTKPVPEVKQRQAGPHPEPHGVPIWGIGNENYGWWQHGHTSAANYGEMTREWAKLLRWTDPGIELIAVGAPDPDWNWTVLKTAGRFVDFLSLHFYWHARGDDVYHATLAGPPSAEPDIVAAWGMCVAAAKANMLAKPPRIAVDEWGVWARTANFNVGQTPDTTTLMRQGLSARSGIDTRFEEDYDLTDALAHATWLHLLWKHPDKVGLATQAQMVNVIAPIHVHAGGALRHTTFHTMAIAAQHAGPVALDVLVECETDSGGGLCAVDVGGTTDPTTGRVHLSLVNRHRDEEVAVALEGVTGTATRVLLWHADPTAGNTVDAPEKVVPVEDKVELDGTPLVLPPHSHTTLVIG